MSIAVEGAITAEQRKKVARRGERMFGSPEQKARLEWMESKVATGYSVLGSNQARDYMEEALTALMEDLLSSPTTVQEYLACMLLVHSNEARVEWMVQNVHDLIYLSNLSPIPADRRNLLHILHPLIYQHPNYAFTIIGIFSGFIPLTSEKKVRVNQALELIDGYFNVDNTEEWEEIRAWNTTDDPQAIHAIVNWVFHIEKNFQGNLDPLMYSVTNGKYKCGSTRYLYGVDMHQRAYGRSGPPVLLSPKDIQRREEENLGSYVMVELLNLARKSIGALERGEPPSKAATLALEKRLITQQSPDELAAIASLLPSGENTTPGSNAEWGLPSSEVINVLSTHATTMTWEQLTTFATLVKEYNEEWALAAMEW